LGDVTANAVEQPEEKRRDKNTSQVNGQRGLAEVVPISLLTAESMALPVLNAHVMIWFFMRLSDAQGGTDRDFINGYFRHRPESNCSLLWRSLILPGRSRAARIAPHGNIYKLKERAPF